MGGGRYGGEMGGRCGVVYTITATMRVEVKKRVYVRKACMCVGALGSRWGLIVFFMVYVMH